MNILMILLGYFPPDIRVEKEAKALVNLKDHTIFILSEGKERKPHFEEFQGVNVIRIPSSKDFLSQVRKYCQFSLSFTMPAWKNAIEKIIKQYRINVVHVHDLPMVKTAVSVAKKYNIPVIADLHENYPEGVRVWRKGKMNWEERIFALFTPVWRWKRLEKSILHYVDKIITVVDEAKEHYINDCGISSEKITVVMNTVNLEEFDNLEIDKSLIAKYENNFVISYIGGFGPHRGIDTAVKSMPLVLKKIPNAKLLLVGKGSKEYEAELRKLCRDLKVEDKVIFTAWVDFSLVPSYIAVSDICLVPHHVSGHTNTTVPHKLFQYMAMRKPVIVTDCKPLKRIVDECNCGIVIPSGDYEKMAEAIIKLYNDKDLAQRMGENGRKTVEEKYNWRNEAKKLVDIYRGVEKWMK